MTRQRLLLLRLAAALTATVGCNSGALPPALPPPDAAPIDDDPGCQPWQPAAAPWSSLPGARPAIMTDPTASPDGKHLYTVGTWLDEGVVKRQILRSADRGRRWCVLPTPDPIIEVAPSRAKDGVLYARACPPTGPGRLYRSENDGSTWAIQTSPPGVACGNGGPLQTSVTDPLTIWVTNLRDEGAGQPVKEVHHSGATIQTSIDGGATWATMNRPSPSFDDVYVQAGLLYATIDAFIVDPRQARRAIAAATPRFEWPQIPQWFATEDGGATWQPIPAPPEALPGQPLAPIVDAESNLYFTTGEAIFRSIDWGRTWSRQGPLPDALVGVTTLGARASGTLFAWHTDAAARLDVDDSVWRTTNGGASWQRLSAPDGDPVLAPAEGVIVSVGTTAWSTTTDGGATWAAGPVAVAPSSIASSSPGQYWGVDRSSQVRAPTRERGLAPALRSFDDGKTWQVAGAASGDLLLDGASNDVAFTQGWSWSLARSEDRGETWETLSPPTGSMVEAASCAAPASCLYVLLSTESEPSRCFISKSADRGRTWTPPREVSSLICFGRNLTVSAQDADHLWSPCGSAICESKDAGASWTTHPLATPADQAVNVLVVLPDGTLLAGIPPANDGTSAGSLLRSTDGGTTWQTVMAGQQGVLFTSRAAPQTLWMVEYPAMAGPRLLRSDDAGATWNLRRALQGNGFDFWVTGIVDRPQGGFLAATSYGLMTLD